MDLKYWIFNSGEAETVTVDINDLGARNMLASISVEPTFL